MTNIVVWEIKQFIYNLECFYRLGTNYNDDEEINNLLYYNAKVIARTESKQGALILYFTGKYHNLDFMGEILE